MPRSSLAKSNVQKLRDYAREHPMSVDVAYHLSLLAIKKDGRAPREAPAGTVYSEAELAEKDKAALAAAKTALGL